MFQVGATLGTQLSLSKHEIYQVICERHATDAIMTVVSEIRNVKRWPTVRVAEVEEEAAADHARPAGTICGEWEEFLHHPQQLLHPARLHRRVPPAV